MDQEPSKDLQQYVGALNQMSRNLLNAGRIELIQHMGSDAMCLRAARVSYNRDILSQARKSGEKSTLRYLMRKHHTSPMEHTSVTFLVEVPIFVRGQWHRHRTQSYNEISRRYTDANAGEDDHFFFPDDDQYMPQALDNKQGRQASNLTEEEYQEFRRFSREKMQEAYDASQKAYKELLEGMEFAGIKVGMARELARSVLPVGTYTRYYATANLLNWYRFISLRSDVHAQYEIRVFSDHILEVLRDLFPVCTQAFEDYWLNATTFSAAEMVIIKELVRLADPSDHLIGELSTMTPSKMEGSELADFVKKLER